MHRLAAAVRVDADEPVTMPMPSSHKLVGAHGQLRPAGDPFVRVGLLFATEDPADPDRHASNEGGISVAVENGEMMAEGWGANPSVDGRPAVVSDDGLVIIFGVADGVGVEVQGEGGRKALLAVARTVRMVAHTQ